MLVTLQHWLDETYSGLDLGLLTLWKRLQNRLYEPAAANSEGIRILIVLHFSVEVRANTPHFTQYRTDTQ